MASARCRPAGPNFGRSAARRSIDRVGPLDLIWTGQRVLPPPFFHVLSPLEPPSHLDRVVLTGHVPSNLLPLCKEAAAVAVVNPISLPPIAVWFTVSCMAVTGCSKNKHREHNVSG